MEDWKDIEGYEGYYQISDLGRVRSFDRMVNNKGKKTLQNRKGIVMTFKVDKNGYYSIGLTNGKQKMHLVHRLVAKAFIQNPKNKPQVNHLYGDKSDNRVVSLEWSTVEENARHASGIGLLPKGSKHHNSVLTEDDALFIVGFRGLYKSTTQMAKSMNVERKTVTNILLGNTWSHVTQIRNGN